MRPVLGLVEAPGPCTEGRLLFWLPEAQQGLRWGPADPETKCPPSGTEWHCGACPWKVSGFLQAKGRTKVRKIDRNTWLLERGCWEGRKAPSPSGSLRPGLGDLLVLTGPRVLKFM